MIHCLITHEIRKGKEAEFESAARHFFSDAICDENTTGAQLVAPVEEGSRTYGILYSFPDDAAREAFYAFDVFKEWNSHIGEFAEGPAVSKELHGLEAFFHGEKPFGPPPTWKMAFVTWLGVNLVTTPLLICLMPVLVGTFGLKFPFENFVFNVFVVSLLSWLVMPNMVKLFGKWLRADQA